MNGQDRIDEANAAIAKAADDKAARWHLTFTGQATPEQAARVLQDIYALTFKGECPAHLAGYDANRTFHFTGRQAVGLEIEAILKNQPAKR